MSEHELTEDELEELEGEPLPDREEMTILPIPGDPVGGPIPIDLPPVD